MHKPQVAQLFPRATCKSLTGIGASQPHSPVSCRHIGHKGTTNLIFQAVASKGVANVQPFRASIAQCPAPIAPSRWFGAGTPTPEFCLDLPVPFPKSGTDSSNWLASPGFFPEQHTQSAKLWLVPSNMARVSFCLLCLPQQTPTCPCYFFVSLASSRLNHLQAGARTSESLKPGEIVQINARIDSGSRPRRGA